MTKPRAERNWQKGTRARVYVPGHPLHGQTGSVEFATHTPESPLIVRLDNGKRAVLATNEAARLRAQKEK